MKNKELEDLVKFWQQRQVDYEDIANKHEGYSKIKFTQKAVATRDCWKELLKLIKKDH